MQPNAVDLAGQRSGSLDMQPPALPQPRRASKLQSAASGQRRGIVQSVLALSGCAVVSLSDVVRLLCMHACRCDLSDVVRLLCMHACRCDFTVHSA